jgi:hypothetical protein
MKKLLILFCLLTNLAGHAQSPGLVIDLRMDPNKAGSVFYGIDMKICDPKKMSDRGSLFSHDTSSINFAALKPADINCGSYSGNVMSSIISGEPEERPFNVFRFSNQVFAWEKILVFRIVDSTSRKRQPPMYIVIPIKYKSFVTTVNIKGIIFQPGKVIHLGDLKGRYDGEKLFYKCSLKKVKGADIRNYTLKAELEAG